MQQFDKQRMRGTQGFGIFDGQEMNMVHASKEKKILKWLDRYESSLLLMHHRFPTSTVNVKRAAHPFSTKKYFGNKQYILVHNGTIRNAEELIVEHDDLGIEYYSLLQDLTFNDSEALLWDFALFKEGKQDKLTARGGIAFICLELYKGKLKKMHFGRNTNPLKLLRTKEGISLSSEGEGEMIEADMLYTWHYQAKRLTTKKMVIPGYFVASAPTYNNSSFTGKSLPAHTGEWDSWDESDGWDDGYTATCEDCRLSGYACAAHYYNSAYQQKSSKASTASGDWGYLDDQMGKRIGNVLTERYGEKFGLKKTDIEYAQDPETQVMLPVETLMDKYPGKYNTDGSLKDDKAISVDPIKRRTAEQVLLARKKNMPTEDEVAQEYLAYLASVRGHFEQAYWSIECDYEKAESAPDTLENIRKRALLEMVMEKIDNDPEYVGAEDPSEAISKTWEALWQTKSKTTA